MAQSEYEETKPPRSTCRLGLSWDFISPAHERLYDSYTTQQKQHAVERFLFVAMLFDLYALLVPGESSLAGAYTLALVALVANIVLFAVYIRADRWPATAKCVLAHAAWVCVWLQLLVSAARRTGIVQNEHLGWVLLFQYLAYATLPFRFKMLLLYSALSAVAYVGSQYYSLLNTRAALPYEDGEHTFMAQQRLNVTMLLIATLMGILSFLSTYQQQLDAFLETKKSLEVKLLIEEQSKEQERLLLSVLPEHVAVQMRKDLGLIDTQFKKIYMSRHENVSILYADIVGFTAISSTYSAQELVAILNELFARFDRLAEKYQQLRIKILGDCYYCISGAPVERPDHAVLCVHMGLSMVKAIKYVQQTTNSPVDMRVGIHTGAVLAGVLGQRQWQFDVYSRDVELANKMESSGTAGRVHISETTLSFLHDEFEVEPAYGERREEALRQAGIKTYFIVKVLKPYVGAKSLQSQPGNVDEDGFPETPSDLKDDDDESVLSPQDENKENEDLKILEMLNNELVHRDDNKELEDQTTWCLSFTSTEMERGYERRFDFYTQLVYFIPVIIIVASGIMLSDLSVPAKDYTILAIFITASVVHLSYVAHCHCYSDEAIATNPKYKLPCGLFVVVLMTMSNIVGLAFCYTAKSNPGTINWPHSSYYMHMAVLNLLGAIYVSPLRVFPHIMLLSLMALAHVPPSLYVTTPYPYIQYQFLFGNETDEFNVDGLILLSALYKWRLLLMLFLVVVALAIFIHYNEARRRAQYVRAVRMNEQREQAADMGRRNQALVYNVLPPHVAQHFMGARRRHHRDLYSQSYAEVGVLFASMPNFSEFYSEESVNNQGLECLRFLNEVISDFDALLEQPSFKDIIKIKTIGSTYMAASGLNPARQMLPSDSVTTRWAHLACLVEFALELKRALQGINEQSFNHFVLKMGVNYGPITAGVIGARKPHYDIWGNTVNVASRMESTGKAGCIQVTEETCHILKNFGYYFEQRGLVAVKGKGQLMTYYLQGKGLDPSLAQNGAVVMATVMEEDPPNGVSDEPKTDCLSPLLANGAKHCQSGLTECPDSDATDALLSGRTQGVHTDTF